MQCIVMQNRLQSIFNLCKKWLYSRLTSLTPKYWFLDPSSIAILKDCKNCLPTVYNMSWFGKYIFGAYWGQLPSNDIYVMVRKIHFWGILGAEEKWPQKQQKAIKLFPQPWQGTSVYGGVQDTFYNHFKQNLRLWLFFCSFVVVALQL